MIEHIVNSFGKDSTPTNLNLFNTISKQKFARQDVIVNRSIDPYLLISEANRIVASGESLYLHQLRKK